MARLGILPEHRPPAIDGYGRAVDEHSGVVDPADQPAGGLRQIGGLLGDRLIGGVAGDGQRRRPVGWSSVHASAAGCSSIATTVSASSRSRSTSARPMPRPPPVTT
jgi:hypothetical protein